MGAGDENAAVGHRLGLVVALWAVAALSCAAAAVAGQGEYLIDVWDTDRGLPSSSVTSLAQTPDGYLWVGTLNGLVRFDGVRFVTFDPGNTKALRHARVESLELDHEGRLWINTYDGSLTSWKAGTFRHDWTGSGVEPGAWLASSVGDEVVFVLEAGDVITRRGTEEWRRIRPAGQKLGGPFAVGSDGALWVRSMEQRLWRIDGPKCEEVLWRTGLRGATINHIAADREGRIWIATEREMASWDGAQFVDRSPAGGRRRPGFSFLAFPKLGSPFAIVEGRARRFSGESWESPPSFELPGAYRLNLIPLEDRQGRLWVAHYGRGLFRFDPDGQSHRLTTADGMPGDRVGCLLEDREGNLWVGVDRGGLARLRRRPFRVLGPADGLSAQTAVSVAEDHNGTVWVGTLGGGLNRYAEGRFQRFDLPTGASGGFVFSVFPDVRTDRLFLSADREDLYIFERGRIRPAPWSVHGIKAILVDRGGRVWLGTKSGLSVWREGKLRELGPEDGFERRDVRAFAEDREGGIWIGAGDGTVYRFADEKLTAFRPPDPSRGESVWSLLADPDGTVWVGSFRGGLLRLRDGRFTRYTTHDGLPSDVVAQILDDDQGRLWVGTHGGIFRVAKDALHAFARGERTSVPCLVYGRSDGLPTLECSGNYQPTAWRGRDGRLWFTTTKGVVSVQPRDIPQNDVPPPVIIEQALVDDTLRSVEVGEPIVLQPGEQRLEIRYTALSLTAPDAVRFRYRLEGLEDAWVDGRARRSTPYSYLRPGHYHFRVIASNGDGVWNEQGAEVAVVVLPHFWQTGLFLGLAILAAVAVVAVVARTVFTRRLRLRLEQAERQRAVEEDRARIAKDIHDDLGAGLTRITLLSELARGEVPTETAGHLSQISDTARELTLAMDEIVWAVNPRNDTLDSLTTYLCQFAQEYLTLAGMKCRLDVPSHLPALPLSSEVRHHLFLAVKETLHNVVQHSGAREVRLGIDVTDGLTVTVADDGRGFDRADVERSANLRAQPGLGLESLEQRLASIGGRAVDEPDWRGHDGVDASAADGRDHPDW